MQFFESIDWDNLESVLPPFIPTPENPTDTGYFEGNHINILSSIDVLTEFLLVLTTARNTLQHLKLSNIDSEDWK